MWTQPKFAPEFCYTLFVGHVPHCLEHTMWRKACTPVFLTQIMPQFWHNCHSECASLFIAWFLKGHHSTIKAIFRICMLWKKNTCRIMTVCGYKTPSVLIFHVDSPQWITKKPYLRADPQLSLKSMHICLVLNREHGLIVTYVIALLSYGKHISLHFAAVSHSVPYVSSV